ncbi:MAG TPA: hypothetical protein VGN12_06185 [Pirellulales bacterium]
MAEFQHSLRLFLRLSFFSLSLLAIAIPTSFDVFAPLTAARETDSEEGSSESETECSPLMEEALGRRLITDQVACGDATLPPAHGQAPKARSTRIPSRSEAHNGCGSTLRC